MIREHCTDYILVAEDPEGEIVLCQEYCETDKEKALIAFNMLHAPRVVLYRQECHTTIIGQTSTLVRKRGH